MRFSPFSKRNKQTQPLDRASHDRPQERNHNEAFQRMLVEIARL